MTILLTRNIILIVQHWRFRMKKKSLLKVFVCLCASTFLLVGCNTRGPVGPQGEQGIPGQQGPQGEPGQDGRSVVSITYTSSNEFHVSITFNPPYCSERTGR